MAIYKKLPVSRLLWILLSLIFCISHLIHCETEVEEPGNLLDLARSLYYEELGCKQGLGSRFNCPSVPRNNSDKCFFNGKMYVKGAKLEEEQTAGQCMTECTCIK